MRTSEEYLRYNFSESEIKEFSKKLAYENKQLEELEEAKKTVAAEFSSKIQSAKSQISKLATNINNGYDYREIKCEILFDVPETGYKTIKRLDTNEVVRVEEMTPQELQRDLFEEELSYENQ